MLLTQHGIEILHILIVLTYSILNRINNANPVLVLTWQSHQIKKPQLAIFVGIT